MAYSLQRRSDMGSNTLDTEGRLRIIMFTRVFDNRISKSTLLRELTLWG